MPVWQSLPFYLSSRLSVYVITIYSFSPLSLIICLTVCLPLLLFYVLFHFSVFPLLYSYCILLLFFVQTDSASYLSACPSNLTFRPPVYLYVILFVIIYLYLISLSSQLWTTLNSPVYLPECLILPFCLGVFPVYLYVIFFLTIYLYLISLSSQTYTASYLLACVSNLTSLTL